ncbi:MBL fold metallo-hydrolase [Nitriliruptoraceae bacterium ZYF776]|nr:MBL fold metallo-hydrolase [Profundirhabdus halotolerans]
MDPTLVPPTDPRAAWELPPFGELPVVEDLEPLLTRVLAPNPSPMTLDGTNTYVVGAPGTGVVAIVDPGPDDPDHLARVRQVVAARDAEVAAVVVTHHHVDHLEAAHPWARGFGVPVVASSIEVAGPDGRAVGDGDRIALPGCDLEVVATPGHCADHLAFRLPSGALLTGDHVLGRGTSVVAHPDGDLEAYLDSLQRTLALGPDALHPGHGPSLTDDPAAVLTYYRDHRAFREAQLLAVLAAGPRTPRQAVEVIYAQVPEHLWGAAEASLRAGVASLVARGQARHDDADVVHLTA